MFRNSLYYLKQHPVLNGMNTVDYSSFPTLKKTRSFLSNSFQEKTTPLFLMDIKIIQERMKYAKKILLSYWDKGIIAYSIKTNYVPIRQILRMDAYAEVTSEQELALALQKGFRGEHIIFNGPYKTLSALRTAWRHHVLLQIDNIDELKTIDSLAYNIRKPIRIGCRLNFKIHGAPISHFGISPTELFDEGVIRTLHNHKYLRFEGIHFHLGTDIEELSVFERVASTAGEVIQRLREEGLKIQYVNCGGGVISHGLKPFDKHTWRPYSFKQYVNTLWNAISRTYSQASQLTIVVEPGRFLVDDSTVFITQCLRVKTNLIKQTVYVNGTTAMLPLSQYRPQIIRAYSPHLIERQNLVKPTIIYGATCREDDVLYRGWLSELSPGDVLIFYCVGAYNQSLGTDFIFSKPKTRFI